MDKDIFKMSESELADYLDECITHKVEKQVIPEDVSIEAIYRDIYKHIRIYFRILQLQLNYIKTTGDMAKNLGIALTRNLPKEEKKKVEKELIRLKIEGDKEILKQIKG